MSTDIVAPEIRLFLARVRHELADLDPAEVEEITDGLEADLTELVAERGVAALGQPEEYAAELRAAAGLEGRHDRTLTARQRLSSLGDLAALGEAASGVFDVVRHRVERLADRLPPDLRAVLASLRPLWWVLRGWLAAQVAIWAPCAFFGIGHYELYWEVVPRAFGWGWLLVALSVIGSVLVGLGRLWPGGRRAASARTVLLVLNVLAIILVPISLAMLRNQSEIYGSGYNAGYAEGASTHGQRGDSGGLRVGGRRVTNIYPYDASGKPLVGVQLFDQDGHALNVRVTPECPGDDGRWLVNPVSEDPSCWDPDGVDTVPGRVAYPWTNGAAQLANVFPMPTRMQEDLHADPNAFSSATPPAIDGLPMATAPSVSLPGIVASRQQAASVQERPKAKQGARAAKRER